MAVSLQDAPSPTVPPLRIKIVQSPAQRWKEIEEEDDNMLVTLQRDVLTEEFLDYLQRHASDIPGLVAHHLLLSDRQECKVSDRSEWLHGSFNACIPVTISNWPTARVLLRCPFPHMVGSPMGLDEKIRCEAATFAWIADNCPQVPIPRLWGFGLPEGLGFTPTKCLPWYRQAIAYIKDLCRTLIYRRRYYTPFIPTQPRYSLKSGYLLVDFIEKEQGSMLSKIWPPRTDEQKLNFYKSLSKIMLNLARCPLPKIGSFTINNSGEISLSNRPLTARLPLLECEGIPTSIPSDRCYSTTDSYIRDLLDCHDLKLKHQPNAVRDKYDATGQMAVLTMMRALVSNFTLSDLRDGPFRLIWTDAHASNIFVNRQYEITSLPDLEWFCALPPENLYPPFWLSGHELDTLEGQAEREDYKQMCAEFLEVFQRENDQAISQNSQYHVEIMKSVLAKDIHFFWASLHHPRATYNLFLDHLQPRFAPEHLEEEGSIQFQRIVARYWIEDSVSFVEQKVLDRRVYLEQLRSQLKAATR
ncbi:uncharacterized protein PV06_08292 [Exophiala oligosperma]|uniref:Aminoglycoside phosphotransferase domain-containing protein n=2 Tax=Chaetothyriales TaxID=34395 RepID=A0A0D2D9A6_9EURO|nr:uncharacterized protein PV06_08292 [Exophiala oligosperma]KAJ9644797.1 hypothetical protein H2204_001259 [Knufia peltigerae]KIW39703.1 hypothetical protein PV06_08292 [Exophiala oligosperma]